jgi:hypothetical protein
VVDGEDAALELLDRVVDGDRAALAGRGRPFVLFRQLYSLLNGARPLLRLAIDCVAIVCDRTAGPARTSSGESVKPD